MDCDKEATHEDTTLSSNEGYETNLSIALNTQVS